MLRRMLRDRLNWSGSAAVWLGLLRTRNGLLHCSIMHDLTPVPSRSATPQPSSHALALSPGTRTLAPTPAPRSPSRRVPIDDLAHTKPTKACLAIYGYYLG